VKYVPAPLAEIIHLTNTIDQPVWEGASDSKGNPVPAVLTYQQFLLVRCNDETFYEFGGKKEGVDAVELLQSAREQIKATAGKGGFHAFEDEVAKRLQQAILHPKAGRLGAREHEHNWIDWVLLWKRMTDAPPAATKTAETE
jgi:hypothetical protein